MHKQIGFLVVVTGSAGAGKDFIIDEFIKTETATKFKLKKIRTNADRPKRDNEPEDAYNFISKEELDELEKENKLAEEVVFTGYSRKATSKSEILKLFEGYNLIWRIDPSLASKIVKGEYFEKYFPEKVNELKKITTLIHIHAPTDIIEQRRKERDKDRHVPHEYTSRDEQEKPYIDSLLNHESVNIVENLDGSVNVTLNKISEIIQRHYDEKNYK